MSPSFYTTSLARKTGTRRVAYRGAPISQERIMRLARALGVLTSLALLACEHRYPSSPAPDADPRLQRTTVADDDFGSAIGAGQYDINGLIVTFAFNAEGEKNGKGEGEFSVYADEGDGLIVDFAAKVTCVSFDPVNHRAWIGGKVKDNRSTDPDLLTNIHKNGRDIWFRVLDDPSGDRSTFVGFEGAAGFITSADYCAGQPWRAANARTWPVVSGGITLSP